MTSRRCIRAVCVDPRPDQAWASMCASPRARSRAVRSPLLATCARARPLFNDPVISRATSVAPRHPLRAGVHCFLMTPRLHRDDEPCCGACASAGDTRPDIERGSPLPAGELQLELSRAGEVAGVLRLSKATTTLGRSATCDVRLDDARVSRVQCRLMQADGQVWIEDSGSGCGTFVNGQRVQRLALRASDRVYIADFVLTLRPA